MKEGGEGSSSGSLGTFGGGSSSGSLAGFGKEEEGEEIHSFFG